MALETEGQLQQDGERIYHASRSMTLRIKGQLQERIDSSIDASESMTFEIEGQLKLGTRLHSFDRRSMALNFRVSYNMLFASGSKAGNRWRPKSRANYDE